jgi:hypothetical protein
VLDVGVFTTMERPAWFEARRALLGDAANAEWLALLDTAVLVLALDERRPVGYDEMTRLAAASGINRWYDKVFVAIVYDNAEIAINLEHTPCDAPAMYAPFPHPLRPRLPDCCAL